MQFLYHPESGKPTITIGGEEYRHLFRSRRHKKTDTLYTRNLNDHQLHCYRVVDIGKKEATLELTDSHLEAKRHPQELIVGWCVIDPKVMEKALPSLNELGVGTMAFIQCNRSQKNHQPDLERCRRILIHSCEQCGRSSLPAISLYDSIPAFLRQYPESHLLDFSTEKKITQNQGVTSIVIGCEGGLTEEERECFEDRILSTKNPLIMRSETAAIAAASLILL